MTDRTDDAGAPAKAPRGPLVPWGAILFALFLAAAMGAYAVSIVDAARRVTDWLLVAPVAVIGIACLGAAVLDDLRQARLGRAPAEGHGDGRIGAALVALVLAYAGASPWLGFDIATAVFVALALVLQGERRLHVVVPTGVLTGGLLVWLFRQVMGVPLPSTLV